MNDIKQRTNADIQIKQFAEDFKIKYENYRYNERTMLVTYKCVDASPSEVTYYTVQIPAFVIGTHYALIQQARIQEAEVARYQIHTTSTRIALKAKNRRRIATLQSNKQEDK